MAWTSPRTWSDGEIPTGALFNAHLSANMDVLKVSRTNLGRLRGLTSDYLADLDGTDLENVAKPATSNTFSAGRTRFIGTSLLRVPVGADMYASDGGGKVPGSFWVEGNYLHHVDASRLEWRYLGTVISVAGAQTGFVYGVANALRYTDASGTIRECVSSAAHHTDAVAVGGSAWVEGSYVHWVRESGGQSYQGHQDISHSDHTDHTDHADHSDVTVPHVDTPYSHTDATTHVDHAVNGHVDHTDHSDTTVPHADHVDHTDHTDNVSSTAHGDVPEDFRPVLV
jgi:hypothetical protein